MLAINQLDLFALNPVLSEIKTGCNGKHIGFFSNAHVPPAMWCSDCDEIVMRLLPPPKNEPEILGYTSATWAWKYKDGNEWTSDLKRERQ